MYSALYTDTLSVRLLLCAVSVTDFRSLDAVSLQISFHFTMLLSPAADRNQDDILSVLAEVLEEQSHKELFGLELGSGTGQHVVHFAQELTYVTWLPSDIKEESRARYWIKDHFIIKDITK